LAVSELKNPSSVCPPPPNCMLNLPDAENASLKVSGVSKILAYHAGSAVGVMNPPTSPAGPPAHVVVAL